MCERDAPSSYVHTPNMNETGDEKKKKNILCFRYSHVNMRVSDCSIFSTDLQNDEGGVM